MKVVAVLSVMGILRNFDQIFVMMNATISDKVKNLLYLIYEQGILKFNVGEATAAATVVILAALAGYVLIQKELPFRNAISSFIMLTMMVPGDLTLISVYQLNKQLHILNSYQGLILNGLISGFSIMMMRNYFQTVPYTLEEAARIDVSGEFGIFARIYMPISLPGLATVFFMEYVARWNSIMLPATLVTDESLYTLPVMLKAMIMSTESTSGTSVAPDNAIMAAIIITTVPLLLIYVFAQKFLLNGISMGAVKE